MDGDLFPKRRGRTGRAWRGWSIPRYVHEKLETMEVSFSVEHPDYPREQPFITVDPTPPARAGLWERIKGLAVFASIQISGKTIHRIELKPPTVIMVRATLEGRSVVTNLFALCSSFLFRGPEGWKPVEGEGIQTGQAEPGTSTILTYHRASDGSDYFGEAVSVDGEPGKTNVVTGELERGLAVSGTISTNVPRPVKRGRVIARMKLGTSERSMFWTGWGEIQEDGSFVLSPMPRGELMLVAMCDGFVSVSRGPQTLPQKFDLREEENRVVIAMEPTATAEIFVAGPDQKPLGGATVRFSPNVQWGNASTILMGDAFDSRSIFIPMEPTAAKPEALWTYGGETDANGQLRVDNLPENVSHFGAGHPDFEMPIRNKGQGNSATRSEDIRLRKGETTRVSVRMQRKGTEVLE